MGDQRSRPTPTTEDARSVIIGTMHELRREQSRGLDFSPESACMRLLRYLAAAHLTIVSEVPPAAPSVDVEKLRDPVDGAPGEDSQT